MTAVDVTDFDRTTVDGLLSTTRSVRRRLDLDRTVERGVIEECLQLALQAPTGSNGQTWRWVIVDDAAKRAALADVYARSWTKYRRMQVRRMETMGDVARDSLNTVLRSGDALVANLARVPVIVIPCVEVTFSADPSLMEMASQFASVYPAVWSFQLALRSRGLGSVLTTIHLWHHAEVADLLAIPSGIIQCALLPVAYTLGTDFQPAARQDVSNVTRWNSWS
jgi:nitroreductase